MAQQRLTDLGVKAAKAKGARLDLWDTDCAGLVLRVTANGRKSWYLFYRHGGKKRRLMLASANEGGTPLAEARKLARQMRDVALAGDDPAAGPKAGKPRTLFDLVARYAASTDAQRKRTWTEERRILEKDVLPRLGSVELEKLRKSDVLGVVESVAERGAYRIADRTARILSAVFNWGMDEDLVALNPAQRVRRRSAASNARGRVLSNAELRALWELLPLVYPDRQRQLMLQLILLTGCRKMEVQAARLSEFALEGDTPLWIIPGERTKNGRRHTLPLSASGVAVVQEAVAAINGKSATEGLLFPAPATGKLFDEGVLNKGLTRAFRAGAIRGRSASGAYQSAPRPPLLSPERQSNGPYTIHDLRRTVAAQLKEMGISPDVRKAILNHAPQGVTEVHYENSADMLPHMAAALYAWDRRLKSIVQGHSVANVISFSRATNK